MICPISGGKCLWDAFSSRIRHNRRVKSNFSRGRTPYNGTLVNFVLQLLTVKSLFLSHLYFLKLRPHTCDLISSHR